MRKFLVPLKPSGTSGTPSSATQKLTRPPHAEDQSSAEKKPLPISPLSTFRSRSLPANGDSTLVAPPQHLLSEKDNSSSQSSPSSSFSIPDDKSSHPSIESSVPIFQRRTIEGQSTTLEKEESVSKKRARTDGGQGPSSLQTWPFKVEPETPEDVTDRLRGCGQASPTSFLSWNVNGLLPRIRQGDMTEFLRFVRRTDPDVIALQEVRLPAHAPRGSKKGDGAPRDRGRVRKNDPSSAKDFRVVEEWLEEPALTAYRAWWSLADSKYSGTMVLAKTRFGVRGTAFQLQESLIIDEHDEAGREEVEHREERDSMRVPIEEQSQRGIRATTEREGKEEPGLRTPPGHDFGDKVKVGSQSTLYGWRKNRTAMEPRRRKLQHNSEGRVILVEFEDLAVLCLYCPNNGWCQESFLRRRRWDEKLSSFLQTWKKRKPATPIVVMGDLNVSHKDADVSHPKFFLAQRDWKQSESAVDEADRGQPGFTHAERHRFDELLRKAELVDTYRLCHPSVDWERGFSWRGSEGVRMAGRYFGKGMRIDYALVSRELACRVNRAEIVGHGKHRRQFFGSDHCPVTLVLNSQQGDEYSAHGAGRDCDQSKSERRESDIGAEDESSERQRKKNCLG